jgi:carbon starvation protein CstA
MIAEGVIALIWATLAISFFPTPEALNAVLGEGGPGLVVDKISKALLGGVGGVMAIIGVIVLPVTSGDTAFRSARLIIADVLKVSQKQFMKRLVIAVPLFAVGFIISLSDFGLIWRYFGWANQALAVFVLWTAAIYLAEKRKFHWIASVPAVFMTAVATTFIANSTIGLNLPIPLSTAMGIGASVLATVMFFRKIREVL